MDKIKLFRFLFVAVVLRNSETLTWKI